MTAEYILFGWNKAWADRKVSAKPCRQCGETFQPTCGGNLFCVACNSERKRRHHAAGQRKWRSTNPAKHAESKAEWDLAKFGITLAIYYLMFDLQGGACAICGTTTPGGRGKTRTLVVDHCHATGKVRGLLCPMCNTALGLAKENTETLRKMGKYLEEHR